MVNSIPDEGKELTNLPQHYPGQTAHKHLLPTLKSLVLK